MSESVTTEVAALLVNDRLSVADATKLFALVAQLSDQPSDADYTKINRAASSAIKTFVDFVASAQLKDHTDASEADCYNLLFLQIIKTASIQPLRLMPAVQALLSVKTLLEEDAKAELALVMSTSDEFDPDLTRSVVRYLQFGQGKAGEAQKYCALFQRLLVHTETVEEKKKIIGELTKAGVCMDLVAEWDEILEMEKA